MNQEKPARRFTLGVASVVVALFAGPAQAQSSAAPMPAMSASGGGMANHGSDALSQSMMGGMKQMQGMKPSGDTDKDFAMMMKMHHEQALGMAQVELEHGKSSEMKAMARNIIAAQKKEIAEFERWMKKHP